MPRYFTRSGFFGVLLLGLGLLVCGVSPAMATGSTPPAATATTTTTPPTATPPAAKSTSSATSSSAAITDTMNWFSGVCLSCGIISRLFAASMQYGKILLPMFGSGVATFLSVAFVLWTLVQVAKMLLPFAPANRTNAIASTLFTKGALVLTVSIILLAPTSYDLYWRYIYKPVVNISINMSNALLAEGTKGQNGQYTVDTFTLKDGNKCSKTVISGLSEEERSLQYRLECMVHSFQNAFSYGIATGWYMITQTGANANNLLIGVIVFVVSITPPITFAVMILDALMRWVIISCLSPALIGCYCFPATRNYANTGFKGLLEAGLTLSVVSVVAVLSAGVIQEAVKTVQAGMNKAGSAVAGAASTAATAVQGAVQGNTPTTPPATTTKTLSSYVRHDPLASTTSVDPTQGGNTPSFNGSLRYPIKLGGSCVKTSDYGMRKHPIKGIMKLHAGVDFACPIGTPVTPAAPGVVIKADDNGTGGYGNLVVIHHPDGGYNTAYAHLDKIFVTKGQQVDVSMIIGNVGSTGHSTGPHLHFELRLGGDEINPYSGNPVDPMPYLNGQPVPNATIASGQGSGQSGQPLLTFAMAATWLLIFGPWIAKQGLVLARTTTDTLFGAFGGALGGMGAAFTPFMNAGMGVAGFLGAFAGKGVLNALANNELVAKLKDGAGAVGGAVGGYMGDRLNDLGRLSQNALNGLNDLGGRITQGLDKMRVDNQILNVTLNVLQGVGSGATWLVNGTIHNAQWLATGTASNIGKVSDALYSGLQYLEAARQYVVTGTMQMPEKFLEWVNNFLSTNNFTREPYKDFQSLKKDFDNLLRDVRERVATVSGQVGDAIPQPIKDTTGRVTNALGEFTQGMRDNMVRDLKNAPAYYATALATTALSSVGAVVRTAVDPLVGDLIAPVTSLVGGAQVGVSAANNIVPTGNLSRMVDLKHAEMTNEAQRHQALSNVDKNIEDMKNTVKQELADLKKREDVLRKDTTTPAADIAKELGDIRALRQVILRSGQEEITRMMSERDDKIRNINEYHDKKQAILQTAQQDYKGKGDLKRNDIREDYNKKHEELSDRIRHNDERLQNIDQKLRENTAMLAAGLPANMTTHIAKEISKLSWEKTEVKAEILRLDEKKAELYTKEKQEIQAVSKERDTPTIAERMLNQRAEKIIEQQNKAQERATEQRAKQDGWNNGVREKLEAIQARQAAKNNIVNLTRTPAGVS